MSEVLVPRKEMTTEELVAFYRHQRDELQRDRQRLDWYERLVNEGFELQHQVFGGSRYWFFGDHGENTTPEADSLREAIDAAAKQMGWDK